MTEKMNTRHMYFVPWPLLTLGVVGVIAFILMLPFILGTVAIVGAFSGYLIWRVNKFFRRIEADHLWKNEEERQQYADQPIIEVMPSAIDIKPAQLD